jgi:hypothetical protein
MRNPARPATSPKGIGLSVDWVRWGCGRIHGWLYCFGFPRRWMANSSSSRCSNLNRASTSCRPRGVDQLRVSRRVWVTSLRGNPRNRFSIIRIGTMRSERISRPIVRPWTASSRSAFDAIPWRHTIPVDYAVSICTCPPIRDLRAIKMSSPHRPEFSVVFEVRLTAHSRAM